MLYFYYKIKIVKSILPVKTTATTLSASADLQYHESAVLIFEIGQLEDMLGSSTYLTLKIQESDDTLSWSDVANSDLTGGTNSILID